MCLSARFLNASPPLPPVNLYSSLAVGRSSKILSLSMCVPIGRIFDFAQNVVSKMCDQQTQKLLLGLTCTTHQHHSLVQHALAVYLLPPILSWICKES